MKEKFLKGVVALSVAVVFVAEVATVIGGAVFLSALFFCGEGGQMVGAQATTVTMVNDVETQTSNTTPTNVPLKVIVDAGHGGKDRGASGASGVTESDINLYIARRLAFELEILGAEVALTRDSEDRLSCEADGHKQRADILRRREIIDKFEPCLVVSIHMNTYPDKSVRGLQCFYQEGAEEGKKYAVAIQEHLNKAGITNKTARPGDYLILEGKYPSVLIECGFLSNPEEEKLLATQEYQEKLARYIAAAICTAC